DNIRFDSIYNYLEKKHIPLIAHLGEPKNCWLPVEKMTTPNDKRYYQNHPQYHMFLHPEYPSYEDQINARNNIMQKHPSLEFIGAHLASEEWSVDKLAESFDRYPELKADLAARISHLQYQSAVDRERVRNFLIKYQDRIIYGSDMSVNEASADYRKVGDGMQRTWLNHWIFLATDSLVVMKDMPVPDIKGLQLPREVIDKIFCKNAEVFFKRASLQK
ncbi:MAG TPA: amidohydrolase family protein, partial [Prolixibacteraceae bacterium]|nr:amidohydrolase family protein [Prolixibacteraceae bacterium]